MNFNGYDLFTHIRNSSLRTYNRVNTYLNIVEQHGKTTGRAYLKKFGRNDQLSIMSMMGRMHKDGFEQYRRDFIRGMNA